MRPKTLDSLIGQENTKTVLRTLINFSKQNDQPVPHILISAPAGFGKTSTAQCIATEIDRAFFTINCANIGKSSKILDIVMEMADKDVIFLDEIHGLTKKSCEFLYTMMEDFCYYDQGQKVDIPKITFIGASTEIGTLPIPLKSRFKFTANLIPYSEDELIEVCKAVFEERKFKLSKDMARLIAKTTRGIPRNMVSRAEWIHTYLSGNSVTGPVDKKTILDIIALQGVNKDGLEEQDISYLKILRGYSDGISLNGIASKLNTSKENVEKVIEPYLVNKNLVDKSAGRGRTLTIEGKRYLNNLEKEKINVA